MFLYSNENVGLSDTALQQARSSVAAAGSNATFGKQPDIALYVIDGASGKLDPAFHAHDWPFKSWALAVWENWFSIEALQIALVQAKAKIACAEGPAWAVVAGPVTALLATAARIGWTVLSATLAQDDLNQQWNFAADSRAAISTAVAQSVRRWRLKRILKLVPTAAPDSSDCLAPCGSLQVLDFARTIKAMVAGGGPGKKAETDWDPVWAHGGQWPQVRKCKVKKWNTTDDSCQLCFEQPGTIPHSFQCKVSKPPKGYAPPPKAAALALQRIGADRDDVLNTRPPYHPNSRGALSQDWHLQVGSRPNFNATRFSCGHLVY